MKKKIKAANGGAGRTMDEFAEVHGAAKMKRMERELATEKAKVDALHGIQGAVTVVSVPENTIRFGLIGDTHFGSLYCHEAALRGVFRYMADQGIETCYHAGDVLDGHKMYKGHEFEVGDIGLDKQVARVGTVDLCGVEVRFITGNHDDSFKQLAGVAVGSVIESSAPGWTFLGEQSATVRFDTPNGPFLLQLIHPGGGSSYAISYRPQKIIESLGGGDKPNMLAIGHYHKSELLPNYRNVCGVQVGTLQKQTPFMARGGLAAHVGAWIVEVETGKEYNIFRPTFIPFYM